MNSRQQSAMSSPTSPDSTHYHELQSPVSMAPPTSSPVRGPTTYTANGRKERRNPSITPRKFTRFFTPRSIQSSTVGSTRRSLFDASASQLNQNGSKSSPVRPSRGYGRENSPSSFARDFKRRKLVQLVEEDCCADRSLTPCVAPAAFTGTEEYQEKEESSLSQISVDSAIDMQHEEIEEEQQMKEQEKGARALPIELPESRIRRTEDRGISGRLLSLNLGSSARSRQHQYMYPVADYQDDTARFYSRPEDVHTCNQNRPDIDACIPFCTTACNTNTLVAVGDERGRIRLLESSVDRKSDFNDVFLQFQAHDNAIIDMSFSQDDSLLATGSGDQRVQVIDMKMQEPVCDFEDNHSASVKAVRFQPGRNNNNILATCSRDGNIQVYDMRCRTTAAVSCIDTRDGVAPPIASPKIRNINSIIDAHQSFLPRRYIRDPSRRVLARNNSVEAVSVTSIAFLPPGREHLLLSSSELDSTIKLWDIRAIPRRHETATALAQTACPESHDDYRQVGLTSLAVSNDGARFYAAARDNAVYTYSTSHFMLGHAPEFDMGNHPRASAHTQTQQGLKPMFAYRHPMLMIASFYIKLALRPARDGRAEMLAVGSTDSCPVLFPTDERHLESRAPHHDRFYNSSLDQSRFGNASSSAHSRWVRDVRARDREQGKLMVSERGTALVEGHQREVSSVAWNCEGDLVGVSDDAVVRVWRDGKGGEARDLRVGGNTGGRRWGCGWAEVSTGYDLVDDE